MTRTIQEDVMAMLNKNQHAKTAAQPVVEATIESKRKDLEIFFGPNADVYLAPYDQTIVFDRKWLATWHWPAFFFTFA
jgi:hypothetical protein